MTNYFLATAYSNPLLLAIATSITIVTLVSRLRPTIYQTFIRVGSSIYSRKPVHARVQDGYQKVSNRKISRYDLRHVLKSYTDYQTIRETVRRNLVGKGLYNTATEVSGRPQKCRMEAFELFPKYQRCTVLLQRGDGDLTEPNIMLRRLYICILL